MTQVLVLLQTNHLVCHARVKDPGPHELRKETSGSRLGSTVQLCIDLSSHSPWKLSHVRFHQRHSDELLEFDRSHSKLDVQNRNSVRLLGSWFLNGLAVEFPVEIRLPEPWKR